jgi:hypothetical protein
MKRIFYLCLSVILAGSVGYMAAQYCNSAKGSLRNSIVKYLSDDDKSTSSKGNEQTKTVDLQPFDTIEAVGAVEIYVTPGSSSTMTLVGPEALLSKLEVKQEKSTLSLSLSDTSSKTTTTKSSGHSGFKFEKTTITTTTTNFSKGDGVVKAYVSASALKSITLSAAAEVKGENLSVGDLSIKVNSAGECKFENLTAKSVKVSASSAGEVKVKEGNITSLTINANSAAEVKFKELKANNVTATADSSAEIELTGAADTVDFIANSCGEINAKKLEIGTVKRASSDMMSEIKYSR